MIFAVILFLNFFVIDLVASRSDCSTKLLSSVNSLENDNSKNYLCIKDEKFSLKRLYMLTGCLLSVTITATVLSGIGYITIHDLTDDIKQGISHARHDIDALGERLDQGFLDIIKGCTNNSLDAKSKHKKLT